MKKNKKIIIIAVVGILILLLIGKCSGVFGPREITKVSVEKVKARTIIETVSANGKIQPETDIKISADVSGEIIELFIEEGFQVKKGDELARIDPDMYESMYEKSVATLNTIKANLANSKARVAQTKAQFINAETSYNRNEKLWKQNVISESEYESLKAAYEVAKAEVDAAEQNVKSAEFNVLSAQASVKEAKDKLNKTAIYAPIDGTISKLDVEKGERVSGASQFSAPEIMRIADLKRMEVTVEVNENDIVRVHLGDTAIIEVDAYINRKFKGIVTEIANSALTQGAGVEQITNFEVKIHILRMSYEDLIPEDNPELSPFRPGMSATVDVQTSRAIDALSVPIQAVTLRDLSIEKDSLDGEVEKEKQKSDEPKDEVVFIVVEEKVQVMKVKNGIQNNMYIEIVEGLDDGVDVVVAPFRAINETLKDGEKVVIVEKNELFIGE